MNIRKIIKEEINDFDWAVDHLGSTLFTIGTSFFPLSVHSHILRVIEGIGFGNEDPRFYLGTTPNKNEKAVLISLTLGDNTTWNVYPYDLVEKNFREGIWVAIE